MKPKVIHSLALRVTGLSPANDHELTAHVAYQMNKANGANEFARLEETPKVIPQPTHKKTPGELFSGEPVIQKSRKQK
jgi:hypothetical protein